VSILLAFQQLDVKDKNVVVYYLGSGRGALIPGIVAASKATKKKVTIYAVEKNPFPLQSLKRRIKENKWSNIVKIVKTDIKSLKFEEKPDIFFSELLGGFGDNELSPECLKWAEE
jgi:protein arginine N-methyltransferase 5